jgi:hypothetical protein
LSIVVNSSELIEMEYDFSRETLVACKTTLCMAFAMPHHVELNQSSEDNFQPSKIGKAP